MALSSYKKDSSDTPAPQPVPSVVYAVGYEPNSTNTLVAKLWTHGTPLTNSAKNAILQAVAGSNIYVACVEANAAASVAKIWKNGTATPLTDAMGSARTLALRLAGSHMDAAGYEQRGAGVEAAKYWKNGTAVSLSDGATLAWATEIVPGLK